MALVYNIARVCLGFSDDYSPYFIASHRPVQVFLGPYLIKKDESNWILYVTGTHLQESISRWFSLMKHPLVSKAVRGTMPALRTFFCSGLRWLFRWPQDASAISERPFAEEVRHPIESSSGPLHHFRWPWRGVKSSSWTLLGELRIKKSMIRPPQM